MIYLLFEYQESVCLHCLKEIDLDNESVELDHFPSILELKFNVWADSKEKLSENLDLFKLAQAAHKKVEYRLLHMKRNH